MFFNLQHFCSGSYLYCQVFSSFQFHLESVGNWKNQIILNSVHTTHWKSVENWKKNLKLYVESIEKIWKHRLIRLSFTSFLQLIKFSKILLQKVTYIFWKSLIFTFNLGSGPPIWRRGDRKCSSDCSALPETFEIFCFNNNGKS